jgi:hypothetical protein
MARQLSPAQQRYLRPIGGNAFRKVDPTNGYAVSADVANATASVAGGLPGGTAKVKARPARIWHKLAYPAAGQTSVFTFFNAAKQFGVTNLAVASSLGANTAFLLSSICFSLYTGIDINSNPVASGALSSVSTGAPLTIAEQARLIYQHGIVNFRISDQPVLDNIYGLDAFPAGRGVDVQPAVATTATTTTAGAAIVNNGAPAWANRMMFDTPWPILAGAPIALEVNYLNLLPLTGGGVLMAEMVGQFVQSATI